MVPLGTLATVRDVGGPLVLTRYNMYPAAAIKATRPPASAPGRRSTAYGGLAKRELPAVDVYEWTEIAYIERLSRQHRDGRLRLLGRVRVSGAGGLYESWSLPLAVILVVPMCVLCSLPACALAKMDINIFTQIGFVVLIGLASKNAILIVEFAKIAATKGSTGAQATLHACGLRLRPIMMTSFAFILGVAAAGGRRQAPAQKCGERWARPCSAACWG